MVALSSGPSNWEQTKKEMLGTLSWARLGLRPSCSTCLRCRQSSPRRPPGSLGAGQVA